MPRRRRAILPGLPHHATQRGNKGFDVFFCEEDRYAYLALLKANSAKYKLDILGYCLMTNHVHVIAIPEQETSLSKALGRTHNDYARWLHARRRECGHLWQNRFFSCPMDRGHLWAALAYVERNPVRAGLVSKSEDWRWSSARRHLGLAHGGYDVNVDLWSQNWTSDLWRLSLEEGLAEGYMRARLQEATLSGGPLGPEQFINYCEQETGLFLARRRPGPKPHAIR